MVFISHSLISEFAESDRTKEEVGAASTKKGKWNLKKKVSWLKLISAKISNNLFFSTHRRALFIDFSIHWYENKLTVHKIYSVYINKASSSVF